MTCYDRRKFLQTTLAVAAVMSGDKEFGNLHGKDVQNTRSPIPNSVTGVATINKLLHGAIIALEFKLDPPVSDWTLASKSPDGSSTTYAGNGYTLELEERHLEGGDTLVDFVLRQTSGERFTLHEYVLRSESSFAGLDRVWMPFEPPSRWLGGGGINDEARSEAMTHRSIPIIININRSGVANLAVAFLDQRIETEMQYRTMTHNASLQPKGTLRLHLKRPTEGYSLGSVSEHRDGFFVSSGHSWFDTMHALRRMYDEKTGRAFRPSPDTAWEPLWVPWGGKPGKWESGREEALDADDILAGARIAADLGMRGMTNWGQWFRDNLPRFNVERMVWAWPDGIGDFVPLPHKYPDFLDFVRKVKSMGIMCMPWISPWMAGRETKAREQLREALIDVNMDHFDPRYDAATSYLCPRNPITQKYVPELMARVMKEYELDGYCVDMVDALPAEPCIARHEHNYASLGVALADTMNRMRAAMDEVNPKAVIEFRWSYSNLNTIYVATAHRAIDTGYTSSYDMDRYWCLLLRSFVPTGVAVHYDPLWWHREEKIENVAKMLSTMVVSGVPQIGNDLVNMPEEHRRLVKAWLSFYHAHKEDLRYGQMRPVQDDPQFSTIKIERERKAFVTFGSFPALMVPLRRDAQEIYLFNCTNQDWLYVILQNLDGDFTGRVYNHFLSPVQERVLSAEARGLLVDVEVPQGGYVSLRRRLA